MQISIQQCIIGCELNFYHVNIYTNYIIKVLLNEQMYIKQDCSFEIILYVYTMHLNYTNLS